MEKLATQAITSKSNSQSEEQTIKSHSIRNDSAKKDSTIVELSLSSEQATEHAATADTQSQTGCIKESVSQAMQEYFAHLGDQNATNLYQMVLKQVEPALLQAVLDHSKGNQSKASQALGLNRGTLRKKLQQYDIS
jgi:Fis family transcriptional regulator